MYILITIAAVAAVLLIALIFESCRELRSFRTTEYVISDNPKIPEGLKGKKIVFLSDYHEACEGKTISGILDAVKALNPDYIFLGGDMLNGHLSMIGDHPSLELINSLANICPVYYSFGNHEKRVIEDYYNVGAEWEMYRKDMDNRVHILSNEKAYLNGKDSFGGTVFGLDIPLEYYDRISYPDLTKDKITELLGQRPDHEYVIMLGHTPDFVKGYTDWGADLILSGHFHGGLIRVPKLGGVVSPRLRLFPKYDYGRYKIGSSEMIVTNGLGQHSLKIRINNIPEIVLINFK